MYRFFLSFLTFATLSFPAASQEVPAFLEGKIYSTNPAKCGDVQEDDSLQLSKEGIFGYEFGCTFLGFDMERDSDTGEIYLAVARANCGDDSGINRPDNFTLIADANQSVRVQSQNEFVLSELLYLTNNKQNSTPEAVSFVSREYKLCQ